MDEKVFSCTNCDVKLDQDDVVANLNTWGIFKCLCSDCIEYFVED
jgi:hypothetical protein